MHGSVHGGVYGLVHGSVHGRVYGVVHGDVVVGVLNVVVFVGLRYCQSYLQLNPLPYTKVALSPSQSLNTL